MAIVATPKKNQEKKYATTIVIKTFTSVKNASYADNYLNFYDDFQYFLCLQVIFSCICINVLSIYCILNFNPLWTQCMFIIYIMIESSEC